MQDSLLYLIYNGSTAYSCATGFTINRETDTEAPPVCKGTDIANHWEQPARGAKRVNGTLDGVVDFSATEGIVDLESDHDTNINVSIVIGTGVSASRRQTITATIQSVSEDSSGTGKATYSVNWVGVGAPVVDTFP
jgi:dihydrodipicolinate reductase